jgi:hypothetical protein
MAMKSAVNDSCCPLFYNEKFREYGIRDFRSTSSRQLTYCYHCGTKLPNSLRKQWFSILRRQYGMNADITVDKRKIPHEFRTEEWWKKRGL